MKNTHKKQGVERLYYEGISNNQFFFKISCEETAFMARK